jgi:hypothetical protein
MRALLGVMVLTISFSCFGAFLTADKGKNDEHKNETSQQQPASTPFVTVNNYPVQASEVKSEKNEHSEAARPAEERIAFWTQILAIITFALAFFTGLLWWATIGLLGDAKETSRKQLRAYITIDDLGMSNVANPILPPDHTIDLSKIPANLRIPNSAPWATGWIRNAGQTPALDVVHWGQAVFDTFPIPQNSLEPSTSIEGFPRSVIGPQVKTSKTYRLPAPLDNAQIDQLRAGTAAIYVYGRITYRDIFGDPHFTVYRLAYQSYSSVIGLIGDLSVCEHGNNTDRDYENTRMNRLKAKIRKVAS